ncbi:tigger transposable element-derived protein 1-like [Macrochelys suwanniensis]
MPRSERETRICCSQYILSPPVPLILCASRRAECNMAPKRKPATSSGAQPKKQRSVPMLEEKLNVLDLLKGGMSVASVARKYSRNESSIRAIKIIETEIRQAVASSAPKTAKVTSQVREKALVKTEKALNLWLEDMNRKRVPMNGTMLQEKALSIYAMFKPPTEEGQPSDKKEFKASQGWLNSFRNRFNLKNVQTTGEAASANEEAAKAYPEQLKEIIEERGYLPEQVFNADETGLFWKKMPTRTYISKSERQAPGFKAAKNRVTVLLCGNAAGHLIKPGLLYRSANPRALKGKNKNLLPVFWQSNKKAWVMAATFLDWFHKCFILEVKQYLEEKGLDFKVLLLVDNAPGHPDALHLCTSSFKVVTERGRAKRQQERLSWKYDYLLSAVSVPHGIFPARPEKGSTKNIAGICSPEVSSPLQI